MEIQNNNKKRGIIIKQINRKGIKKLFENNYIFHSVNGLINRGGESVGFRRTRHKMYIRDKYADIAEDLLRGWCRCLPNPPGKPTVETVGWKAAIGCDVA